MGLTEIVVLVVVALFIGGMGALAYYANSPAEEGAERAGRGRTGS
jgi:hypothetical protein